MIQHLLDKITHTKMFHRSHILVHTGYFSFVFIEGHGIYAVAGGMMALFTIILALAGQE